MEDIYESDVNRISASASIHPNVILGKGNTIMEGVIIREGVQIGDNNYIGPYCIIGDPAEKSGYFDTPGKVVIGSGNRFTKQVTVDAGTESVTIVKNNVIMLKNTQVGHDAHIEDDTVLSCNVVIGGFTKVGKGCNFGLGSVAHQRLTIPDGVMIGMNSAVTKRTPLEAGRKYVGSPARDIGPNIKPQASCVESPLL